MKRSNFSMWVALVVLWILPCALSAQVSIEIRMNQKYYLQYEGVFLKIGLRNMSAHPLAFGESDGLKGGIRFAISTVGARYQDHVKAYSEKIKPDMRGTIIPPGGVRNLTFNLSKLYDLRKNGKYTVKAILSHPQLRSEYESNSEYFIIIPGTELWQTTVGLPDFSEKKNDAQQKITTRKYRLLSYFTGRVSVYAISIEDRNNVYFLKRIGFDLGRDLRPQCEVDFLSRLNLMVAASPKVFAYYQYNSDGKLEKKQIYIKTNSTPALAVDHDSGSVFPVGGREARKDIDFEEIKMLPFMEDMNTRGGASIFEPNQLDRTVTPDFKSGEKRR